MKWRAPVLVLLVTMLLLLVIPFVPLVNSTSSVSYAPYSQTIIVQPESYRYVSTTLSGSTLAPLPWVTSVSVVNSNDLQILPANPNVYNNVSYDVIPLPNPYTVTITNSQSITTPAPFVQLINLTESELGQTVWQYSLQFRFLNLLFKNATTGSPLYAWIMNYTSTYVLAWVKLPYGIPASSSININVSVTDSVQYPYTGINPAVFSGYDNGQDVFVQYGYFGDQIPSGWTTGILHGSFSATATPYGLEMLNNVSCEGTYVYDSIPNENNNYVVIVSWWYTSGKADGLTQELYGNVSDVIGVYKIGNTAGGYAGYAEGGTVADNDFYSSTAYIKNSTSYATTTFDGQGAFYVTTYFAIEGSTEWYGYTNVQHPFQIVLPSSFTTFHLIADRTEPTVLIGAGDGSVASYIYLDFVLVIPTPPNNVMPSVTAVSGSGRYLDTPGMVITVSNSQSIATPAPFDQFLNITESQLASALGSTTASQVWQQAMSDHFLNLVFVQNGQTLYAWIQNYTSTYVLVWVKLPNGIPASSSTTINIYFTNSIQYPYTGIDPAVYSGYDNGQDVFTQYAYFGNQIPSGWATGVCAGPTGVNTGGFKPTPTAQGLEMVNNAETIGTYAYASLPNENNYTVIVSWWYSGTADSLDQELYGNPSSITFVSNIGSTDGGDTPYASGGTVAQNDFYTSTTFIKNSSTSVSTTFDGQGTYYVTTYFAIQGNTEWYGYANVHDPFQIMLPSSFSSFHLTSSRAGSTVFIGAGDTDYYSYIYLDFVIVIPTPPNNVMPSIVSETSVPSSSPAIYGLNMTVEVGSGTSPYGGFAIGYGVNYPAQGINGNYEPALPYGSAGIVVVLDHGAMTTFHLFLFYNGQLLGNWSVGSFTTGQLITVSFTYTSNQVTVYWNNGTQYKYTVSPSTSLSIVTNTYTIDIANSGTYYGQWIITSFQFYNSVVTVPAYYATFSWTAVTLSNGVKALYGFTGADNPLNITVSTNVSYIVKGIVKIQNYSLTNALYTFSGNVNYVSSSNGLYLLLNVYPGTEWYLNVTIQIEFTAPSQSLLENFTVPVYVYAFAEKVSFPTLSNSYYSGQTISITNTSSPNFPPSLGYEVASPAIAEIDIYGITNGFVYLPYTFSETVSSPTTYNYVIKVFEDNFETQTASGSFTIYPISNQPVIFVAQHPSVVYIGSTVKLTFLFVYNSPVSNTSTFYQKTSTYEWSFAKLITNNSYIEFKASWSSANDGLLILTNNNIYLLPFNGSAGVTFVNNSVNTVQITVSTTHNLLISSNGGTTLSIANTSPVIGLGFSYNYGPVNVNWFYVSDIILQSNGTADQSYLILTGTSPSTLSQLVSGYTNTSGYGTVTVTLTDTPYELVDIDWSGSTYTIINISVINRMIFNLNFTKSPAGVASTGGSTEYLAGHGYFLTPGYFQYGYVIMNNSFVPSANSIYCMKVYIQNESSPPADAVYFVLGPDNATYIHDGGMFPYQNSEGGVLAGVELYNATYNGYAGPGLFIYTANLDNGWYHVSVEPKPGQTVTLKLGVEPNLIWITYYIGSTFIANFTANVTPTFASHYVEIIGTTGASYTGWVLTQLYVNETVSASIFATTTTSIFNYTQTFGNNIEPNSSIFNFSSAQPWATLIGIAIVVIVTLLGWKFGGKAGVSGGIIMGLIMTAYLGLMSWYIFYIFVLGIALLLAKIFVDKFMGSDE